MWKFIKRKSIQIIIILLIVAIIVLGFHLSYRKSNKTVNAQTLRESFQSVGELITTKYYYTDIAEYTNFKDFYGIKIPFTTDQQLIIYNGEIASGINLYDVKTDVNEEEKTIKIILPEIKVFYHTIDQDSFKVYNIRNSIFTEISMQEYADFLNELKNMKFEEMKSKINYDTTVKLNTETLIKEILGNVENVSEYKLIIEWGN